MAEVTAKSPAKVKGQALKHKTRSPGDSVKESERSLQKLLEDFEHGKLNAFGKLKSLNTIDH